MIQNQTVLDVTDNSGVKTIRCIQVAGGFKKRYGVFGSTIKGAIQGLRQRNNKKLGLKKGNIVLAVVVQTRSQIKRKDGQILKFFKNSVVVVDKQLKPLSSRILTPLCNELRNKNFVPLLSIAPSVI
jgi:large subunit ribosomal protein L14